MQVGDRVTLVNDDWMVEGHLVKIVCPFKPLDDEELIKYADLRRGDRDYNPVRGENCKVHRVVIKRINGSYVIAPMMYVTNILKGGL